MQRKPKSNSIVQSWLAEDGHTIHFKVNLGPNVGFEEFTFDTSLPTEAMRARAEIHGWLQRITDGSALSRDPTTGKPAMPADKAARMKALIAHYLSGTDQWTMTSGERGATNEGLIVTAICRAVTSGNIDEANLLIDKTMKKREMTRSEALRLWADTKQVAEAIAAIKAERATGDAGGLLDEMMGD